MAYLGIGFILIIVYLIEWFDNRADEKHTADVERTHEQMYALIDENFSGREARERKAQVDAMIGAMHKDIGRDYKPKNIKQVTTVKERKMRIKSELDGTADDTELIKAQLLDALDAGFGYPDNDEDDWYYEEHTHDEKREHLIEHFISSGYSKGEAEIKADEFYEFAKGL